MGPYLFKVIQLPRRDEGGKSPLRLNLLSICIITFIMNTILLFASLVWALGPWES